MPKRIGLLGCGAIGTQIALAIDSGEVPAVLTHVYDSSPGASDALASRLHSKPEVVANAHLLSSGPLDMVVEAASQDAVRDVALSVLQNRRDLMVMSAGALLDESVYDVLHDACKDYNRRIYLPSGAVAGLDAIRAVADELESLSITTTKHPRALRGARFFETSNIDLDGITGQPVTIFEGTAGEAVGLFPANINVAALLSLAGIGSRETRVVIVADPSAERNTHRVVAEGGFGRMTVVTENLPDPDNPKTSRLATLSAIQALVGYCTGGIRVGT